MTDGPLGHWHWMDLSNASLASMIPSCNLNDKLTIKIKYMAKLAGLAISIFYSLNKLNMPCSLTNFASWARWACWPLIGQANSPDQFLCSVDVKNIAQKLNLLNYCLLFNSFETCDLIHKGT